MDVNLGILQVIGELRITLDKSDSEIKVLRSCLEEARGNIRSLMDENAQMQARLTEMHEKYEVQRQ